MYRHKKRLKPLRFKPFGPICGPVAACGFNKLVEVASPELINQSNVFIDVFFIKKIRDTLGDTKKLLLEI